MSAVATLAVDQGEVSTPGTGTRETRRLTTAYAFHMLNDPDILFEEYLHYAKLTRAEEKVQEIASPQKKSLLGVIANLFNHQNSLDHPHITSDMTGNVVDEKSDWNNSVQSQPFDFFNNLVYVHPTEVSDAEWRALSRGVRTVGWSTCFYLITSDIIGPFGIP